MSLCIICKKGGLLSNVLERGRNTIIQASEERQDEVREVIAQHLSVNSPLMIHADCRRDYTAASNIAKIVKENAEKLVKPTGCSTRRHVPDPYDYPTHCVICGKRADPDKFKRNPKAYSRVCKVEMVGNSKKKPFSRFSHESL